jgi:hypothetical protein
MNRRSRTSKFMAAACERLRDPLPTPIANPSG